MSGRLRSVPPALTSAELHALADRCGKLANDLTDASPRLSMRTLGAVRIITIALGRLDAMLATDASVRLDAERAGIDDEGDAA